MLQKISMDGLLLILEDAFDLKLADYIILLQITTDLEMLRLIYQEGMGSIARSNAPDFIQGRLSVQLSNHYNQYHQRLIEKRWMS